MVTHMKTTVEISDAIGRQARHWAAREGTTLRALIEEGLRRVLDERDRAHAFRLRKATVGGQGLNPDLHDTNWDAIRELSYGGRP